MKMKYLDIIFLCVSNTQHTSPFLFCVKLCGRETERESKGEERRPIFPTGRYTEGSNVAYVFGVPEEAASTSNPCESATTGKAIEGGRQPEREKEK